MDPQAYTTMADTEARHWWFVARREILDRIIGTLGLPPSATILEVGSGTGGNLEMLSRHGSVSAIEMDRHARQISREKAGGHFAIREGRCPHDIPFKDERFDLICMFDVLEHIDEDIETLVALRRLLGPGGRMLITVPAYAWLWSGHDVFLHHKRRYTARSLRRAFAEAGLSVDRLTYFNSLLLPMIAAVRLIRRVFSKRDADEGAIPAAPVNGLLRSIFRAERQLLSRLDLPAGVSLLGVVHAA